MLAPTESTFSEYIGIATEHQVPVSGSLGRAVLIGETYISPVRNDGSIRDIDIVNVGQHAEHADALPAELEFDRVWLDRFLQGGNLIYPGKREGANKEPVISVAFPFLEQAFADLFTGQINGQDCFVLRPETQLALDTMFGTVLSKRRVDVEKLGLLVAAMPSSERLDPEILAPLSEFSESVAKLRRRKLYLGARATYHAIMPSTMKSAAHPLIKKIARGRLV